MSQEMTRRESRERDRMFLKFFLKSSPDAVTEEEVAYFRDHPDEIDEWTKPVNAHKMARGGPTRDRQDPGS